MGVPGHQEIEIGLVKLYRATGEQKYLDLARFFLDQRGNAEGHELYGAYNQDHLPVVEQTEAVGHAVRAGYMYAGMADVGALTGDRGYVDAIDRDLGERGRQEALPDRRHRGPPRRRGLRRRLRAAQPHRLRRDLRRHRQRAVEPPPVPAPRRREVPRRPRAGDLQRLPLRGLPRRRALLLPEPARLRRALRRSTRGRRAARAGSTARAARPTSCASCPRSPATSTPSGSETSS